MAAAVVGELVHLLGDDVGGLADALEHADVLDHRRHDLPVAGRLDDVGEDLDEAPPAVRLRRQDVAHPGAGLELGHGRPGYPVTWNGGPMTSRPSAVRRSRPWRTPDSVDVDVETVAHRRAARGRQREQGGERRIRAHASAPAGTSACEPERGAQDDDGRGGRPRLRAARRRIVERPARRRRPARRTARAAGNSKCRPRPPAARRRGRRRRRRGRSRASPSMAIAVSCGHTLPEW